MLFDAEAFQSLKGVVGRMSVLLRPFIKTLQCHEPAVDGRWLFAAGEEIAAILADDLRVKGLAGGLRELLSKASEVMGIGVMTNEVG